MTPLILLIAVAASTGSPPTVDPQRICKDAREGAAVQDQNVAYDACIRDEQAARDQLNKNWSRFSANARATCSEPDSMSPSYVEVLTCLEMQSGADFSGTPKSSLAPATQPDTPKGP